MLVVIEGFDLPGLRCGPDPEGRWYESVHVGVCAIGSGRAGTAVVPPRPWSVTGLVAGDAPAARWELQVAVRRLGDGIDFGGPFVRGKRGDRHVGLAWGELPGDGAFRLFRLAKLRLDLIEPAAIEAASEPGGLLLGRLGLTDRRGNPLCASVRPPGIAWSAEAA
ncbi:MAG: monooxygenase [Candidatus Nephthysia bennettiae]|uniref:Monooxygenase n=1 Tax=Candidatus Nephthysia bennettiae TaxID=3127016 RepID=A0A934K6X3_9BACT|nr:monooxygenase [Candidatus Dormibacteraeota bacterium]PZR95274.1 MAG: monooxygenase [Candidatus Dormibacteraeota bacterium]